MSMEMDTCRKSGIEEISNYAVRDKEARENIDKLMIFYVSLGCKSKEIAEYVSTQFGKLVFDACFARHFKGEEFEWLD